MEYQVVFSQHAIVRMFERGIQADDVVHVMETGRVIEEYADDTPYPSKLISGCSEERPIHVVVARNVAGREMIVVTVYEPDLSRWESGFERRKL